MNKQRGGTLLGLVLGILMGLAAALAVAVFITKMPMPFMSTGNSRTSENDAQEAKKNKDWNPNAALAGKNSVKPPLLPLPAVSSEEPAPAAPDPVVVIPAKPRVAPPLVADPLGDLAKRKLEAPSSGSVVEPFNYFIQAGAFRTPEDAEQQRARLLLLGMQANISEREQAGRTVYRIRLGPFDKEEAEKTKERLDGNSIETVLVRAPR